MASGIAFVETTVLTNYLLKKDGSDVAAKNLLAQYSDVRIPHFAWKEFKRGPLANFVWAHNKLVETGSFLQTLLAVQRLATTPQRYLTATAIQALHTSFERGVLGVSLRGLVASYGPAAQGDAVLADALRLELKRVILSCWKRRRVTFGGAVDRLSCYPDEELGENGRRIDVSPRDCPKGIDCCLRTRLTKRQKDVSKLRAAIPEDGRTESRNRAKVLRQLEKHPNSLMDHKDCRSFGDAYFVLFCPDDATILTINLRDIQPLADKLGVRFAASP